MNSEGCTAPVPAKVGTCLWDIGFRAGSDALGYVICRADNV